MANEEDAESGEGPKMMVLPPPPSAEPPSKNRYVTTKYPRLMSDEKYAEVEEEPPLAAPSSEQPGWLLPPEATEVEARSAKFDGAFGPITELSSEDVVVGCAVKGADFLEQSRSHVSNFRRHLRSVDGLSKLEAAKVVELPVGVTKACLGGGFYSVALTAKFGPRALDWGKRKCVDWQVYERAATLTHLVKDKTEQGLSVTKVGVAKALSWIKSKVATFYGLDNANSLHPEADLEGGQD